MKQEAGGAVVERLRSVWRERTTFRSKLVRFGTFAAASLGVVAGMEQIFEFMSVPLWGWAVAWAASLAIAAAWLYGSRPHLPAPDELLGPDCSRRAETPVTLKVPASDALVTEALDYVRSIYGRSAFTSDELRKWTSANPLVFGVLVSRNADFLGYFDILPLTAEAAARIRDGSLPEKDIAASHILGPGAMRAAAALYVASICVRDPGTTTGNCRAAELLRGIAAYVQRYYGAERRTVLAVGATSDGVRLLRRFGAQKIATVRSGAGKGRHVFEFDLTPAFLESLSVRIAGIADPPRLEFHDAMS